MPNAEEIIHEQREQVERQGRDYEEALGVLKRLNPHASKEVDDYLVSIVFEEAPGFYVLRPDETLAWETPPAEDNAHFEVIVQDREDKRFIPQLDIRYRLFDDEGHLVVDKAPQFLWHPYVYHYGINGRIPREGNYVAEVTIMQPSFLRHDEVKGKRYRRTVTVRFDPVHVKQGRMPHGPEK